MPHETRSWTAGLSLSQRLQAVVLAVVAITALAVAAATNLAVVGALAPLAREHQRDALEVPASLLLRDEQSARADVLAAARGAPCAQVLAAHALGAAPSPEALAAVRSVFRTLLLAYPQHLRLGLLDAHGREVLRVERPAVGAEPRDAADIDLEDLSARPFVRAALSLPTGQVTVSGLDLEQHRGRVTLPHTPVLRATAGVADPSGRTVGATMLSVAMAPTLDTIRRGARTGSQLYLVDAEGGFVIHPDPRREFGRDLGHAHRWAQAFPDSAALVAPGAPGRSLDLRSAQGARMTLTTRAVAAAAGGLTLVGAEPSTAAGITLQVQRAALLAAALAALAAAGVAALLARHVTQPLRAMTAMADRLLDAASPMTSAPTVGGELGILSRALQRLQQTLRERDEAIAREHTHLRAVVDAVPSAMITVDGQGLITSVNQHAEDLFGHPRQDLVGAPLEKLVPARQRSEHGPLVERYLSHPQALDMGGGREVLAQRADGSEVPVQIHLSPINATDGPLVLASVFDISERRQAEAVRSRLAAIVENSFDGILSFDFDGTITSWNRGAEHIFGYAADETVGRPLSMLLVPGDTDGRVALDRLLQRLSAGERVEAFDAQRLRKDGRRITLSIRPSPLADSQGRLIGASGIIRDVTEARTLEADLRRSNAELEQFAYVASHDLQEPLRMVANYTELLAEGYRGRLDERADKYIHFASDGARRMQRLVSDLLSYSRVGTQGRELVPVNAAAVARVVLHELQPLVDETGATVELGRLPRVRADPSQLHQLLLNLLGNAIKYRGEAAPHVQVEAQRMGPHWRFEVRDNGIGIDMRHADRIFQMFQRLNARSRFPGSGMGLAIARRIVERHGGTLGVHSQPGAGATFHFTLPALEDEP